MLNGPGPIRVLHVVDAALRWDERLALQQLLDRLAPERFSQQVACLGPEAGEAARLRPPVVQLHRMLGLDLGAAAALTRAVDQRGIQIIAAWGLRPLGSVCSAHLRGAPVLTWLSDPARAAEYAGRLSAVPRERRIAALCATEIVRRRLIEHGATPEPCITLRPAVDFAAVARIRKANLRERLGIPAGGLFLALDSPATRDGGQFCGFWAAAVRSFIEPGVRVAVAGCSRERDRLARLARGLDLGELLISPGDEIGQEELVAAVDVLLMPAAGETAVTSIAWAMAAGVPVVAAATRATAELLAHEHNAFLIKPDVTKRLALRFAEALGRRQAWSRLRETARGQAYEVFSLRRFADQFEQVCANLLAGRPAAEGIADPALRSA